MDNTPQDLSNISSEDAYSLAILLLSMVKDDPSYSSLGELPYIINHQAFIDLIRYYEGQTIRIPTIAEVKKMMRVLLTYQYYLVEKYPWHEAIVMAGYDESESRSAERYLRNFMDVLAKYKIGDRIYGKGTINSDASL